MTICVLCVLLGLLVQWNLRAPQGGDYAFVKAMKADGYAVICFERCNERDVDEFCQKLENFARQRHMDLGRRIGRIIDGSNAGRRGDSIESFIDLEIKQMQQRPGLVICFVSDKQTQNAQFLYPAIKRWSHTVSGIPTQCLQGPKALGKLKTSPQYHAGVLLKINLKLGGHNLYSPKDMGGLPLLREKPTIVFGVDVNHAAANSSKPSFYALVASTDEECASYHSVVGAQKSRQEKIEDLSDHVRQCLRKYKDRNDVAPQRIFFFRDGVANNQFNSASAQPGWHFTRPTPLVRLFGVPFLRVFVLLGVRDHVHVTMSMLPRASQTNARKRSA